MIKLMTHAKAQHNVLRIQKLNLTFPRRAKDATCHPLFSIVPWMFALAEDFLKILGNLPKELCAVAGSILASEMTV